MSRGKTQTGDEGTLRVEIGIRLRELRQALDLTQNGLADKLGTRPHVISRYETGERVPTVEWLTRLGDLLPEANTARVLDGKGPVIWNDTTCAEGSPGYVARLPDGVLLAQLQRRLREERAAEPSVVYTQDRERLRRAEGDAYVSVAYVEDAAAAGTGRLVEDNVAGYVLIHRRVAPNPEQIVCIQISGDSMEPALPNRSIVAVDKERRDPERADGRIVCARTEDGEVVIKRLGLSGRNHITLRSDNRAYAPIVVDLRVIPDPLIGRVIWAWVDLR